MPNVHREIPPGHSNVYASEAEWWNKEIGVARIPLVGGNVTVAEKGRRDKRKWKALPPLALTKEEWEEIGRRLGWLSEGSVPAPEESGEEGVLWADEESVKAQDGTVEKLQEEPVKVQPPHRGSILRDKTPDSATT